MHIVNLQSDWYDPTGTFRYRRDNPHQIAEDLFDSLPSTAIVDGVKKGEWSKKKVDSKEVKATIAVDKEELRAREEAAKAAAESKAKAADTTNLAVSGKL